ncbi:hypothetical protein P8935_24110 [Telmatobacter sp. DSM 110680]|uniref:Nucleotide modification associated domain-containing protein n=1 Tax=Telmatobacter sp. DSM 110680 TaxID=3036704 RepID=A0AAU7DIW5_9BACT
MPKVKSQMRGILVRVGIDQAYGKWNAPVNVLTGSFVFVPIPDGPKKVCTPGRAKRYEEVVEPLAEFARINNLANLRFPDELSACNMHLDPDFEHLTYGDNGKRRGAGVASLSRGDILVFYGGLRSITPPHDLIYGLVGLYVIDEVIRAVDVPRARRDENAHTRWTVVSENDVVVRARAGESGRFDRCIPIGSWRDKAYRVRPEIEHAWGGLSVKNGYIQRSAVPPEFKNAKQFLTWFQNQHVNLLQERF